MKRGCKTQYQGPEGAKDASEEIERKRDHERNCPLMRAWNVELRRMNSREALASGKIGISDILNRYRLMSAGSRGRRLFGAVS